MGALLWFRDPETRQRRHFWDPYTSGNMLSRLRMSWGEDVNPRLDKHGYLSPANMRWLRDEIASRELALPTIEELTEQFLPPCENLLVEWHDSLIYRRQELIDFLDRAIQFKKRVKCSI